MRIHTVSAIGLFFVCWEIVVGLSDPTKLPYIVLLLRDNLS